jgi:hypothetical protein
LASYSAYQPRPDEVENVVKPYARRGKIDRGQAHGDSNHTLRHLKLRCDGGLESDLETPAKEITSESIDDRYCRSPRGVMP